MQSMYFMWETRAQLGYNRERERAGILPTQSQLFWWIRSVDAWTYLLWVDEYPQAIERNYPKS
jgi:hypothetical protein